MRTSGMHAGYRITVYLTFRCPQDLSSLLSATGCSIANTHLYIFSPLYRSRTAVVPITDMLKIYYLCIILPFKAKTNWFRY